MSDDAARDTDGWKRFVGDDEFSIAFPAGWQISAGEDGQLSLSPLSGEDVAITLTRLRVEDGSDATAATVHDLLDAFRGDRPLHGEPLRLQSERWDGVEAALGPGVDDHPDSGWIVRVLRLGQRVAVVSVTGDAGAISAARITVEAILDSVRLPPSKHRVGCTRGID